MIQKTKGRTHDAATSDNTLQPLKAIDDPDRLARLYIQKHGTRDAEQILWAWRDDWLSWDGVAYRIDAKNEIRGKVHRRIETEFDAENLRLQEIFQKAKAAGELDEGAKPPKVRKITATLETNVIHALTSQCLLSGHRDQPSWLVDDEPFPADEILATKSGLLHLPSLNAGNPCLLEPTPVFFSCNALPYSFDPAADCPEWVKFLESVWPDDQQSIQTMQEWFGYCLLPDTSQHKIAMLVGPPRSGKGTIGRILRAVIGEQNLASPTLASLSGPFGLWCLLHKQVALISDARLSTRVDAITIVERLLSISGEDPQDVHRKNLSTLAGIRLPVRFFVMTNELPNMRDASGALATRVLLLRMTRSFLGREDKTLGKRLSKELPGILNWSIRGWQRLTGRAYFEQPESGQELIDDLSEMASPIGAFVVECCIVGPEFFQSIEDLFSSWKAWCNAHGRDHHGTEQTFGRDLRAKLPTIRKTRPRTESGGRACLYNGIGLRELDSGTQWDATQSYVSDAQENEL